MLLLRLPIRSRASRPAVSQWRNPFGLRYTAWVKTDPDVTFERHMVDVQKAVAEHREATVRRQESTTQEY